jgi:hypothetical protein
LTDEIEAIFLQQTVSEEILIGLRFISEKWAALLENSHAVVNEQNNPNFKEGNPSEP